MSENINDKILNDFLETAERLYRERPADYIDTKIIEEFEPKDTDELIKHYSNEENIKQQINKSCNAIPIKKQTNKKKINKLLILKIIASILIAVTIITYIVNTNAFQKGIIEPIKTHFETENIREECVEKFYEKLKEIGINPNDYTVEGLVNNCPIELLKENIFEMYLIIEKETNILKSRLIEDNLIKRIGYGESFSKYIINEGYFKHSYSYSGETIMATYANRRAWENAMEAQRLAEKQEQNNNIVRKG